MNVKWKNNKSVSQIAAYAKKKTIIIRTKRHGGFEQFGPLPKTFYSKDVQMTTKPGDIVLYSSNQIVVFYSSNDWSYTRLGHIKGMSAAKLKALLGGKSVTIKIKSK